MKLVKTQQHAKQWRYDNDAETLAKERARLTEQLVKVHPSLTIIALEDNRELFVDGGDDDAKDDNRDHENYFVLDKSSLLHEEALKKMVKEELPERFSLVRRNHQFLIQHGSMGSYTALEMTLAIKRLAYAQPIKRRVHWVFKVLLSLLFCCVFYLLFLW
jgi:hypothetical protein